MIEVTGVPHPKECWVWAGRIGRWWRREGHRVHPEDLSEVLELSPEIVVIGTGFSGLLRVTEEAEALLSSRGMELRVVPAREAMEFHEDLVLRKRATALLHLTC